MPKLVVDAKESALLFYDWGRVIEENLRDRLVAAGFRFRAGQPYTLERPWRCHAHGAGHFEVEQD
jgi:hypothetical protein